MCSSIVQLDEVFAGAATKGDSIEDSGRVAVVAVALVGHGHALLDHAREEVVQGAKGQIVVQCLERADVSNFDQIGIQVLPKTIT